MMPSQCLNRSFLPSRLRRPRRLQIGRRVEVLHVDVAVERAEIGGRLGILNGVVAVGRVAGVGVKAAPGLPLGLVPGGWEVELLADRRELKEAALWSPALATTGRRATVFPGPHTLAAEPRSTGAPPVPCGPPGAYLLDPSPAVTRAGLVEELARDLGAWKLDPRIAFLSADRPLRSPFGRLLRVDASLPWNLKRLRAVLRERGVGTVEVRKRGSAVDVDDLTARLRLRGDARAVVVLTRVADRPWALVCAEAR